MIACWVVLGMLVAVEGFAPRIGKVEYSAVSSLITLTLTPSQPTTPHTTEEPLIINKIPESWQLINTTTVTIPYLPQPQFLE